MSKLAEGAVKPKRSNDPCNPEPVGCCAMFRAQGLGLPDLLNFGTDFCKSTLQTTKGSSFGI